MNHIEMQDRPGRGDASGVRASDRAAKPMAALARPVAVCCAVLFALGLWPARADALGDALAQLKTYHFGQDRAVLDKLARLVVEARATPAVSEDLAHRLAAVLQTDAAFDAKQFVCRELVTIATEREAPALAGLLKDEQLSHLALQALVRMPGRSVDALLREALGQTTGRTQIGIIHTLGDRRDGDALASLVRLLEGPDETLAAAAVAAGKIGGQTAAEALIKLWASASGAIRPTVGDALLTCADVQMSQGDMEGAARICELLYRAEGFDRLRAAGLRGLAKARPSQAVELAAEALKDEGAPRQQAAAASIRELPGAAATRTFARQLASLGPVGQVLALSALGERGDVTALPQVTALCLSADGAVRLAALRAVGVLGDDSSVNVLLVHASGGDDLEREAARAALTALRGPGINQTLAQTLGGGEAKARVEIINALSRRGAAETSVKLRGMTDDAAAEVRLAAFRALRELSPFTELPALVELLLRGRTEDRDEAEKMVLAVARQGADEAQRTAVLLGRLAEAKEASTRVSLLRLLGQIGGGRALGALRAAARDDHAEVRLTVTRSLAEWSTDEPLADLLATVREGRDEQQRLLALRGYIRLIGLNEARAPKDASRLYREAMGLATNAPEKRMVLAGLAELRTFEALELAAATLADPVLRPEAEVAVLAIARGVCGAYPDRTKAVLARVLEGARAPAASKQAQEVAGLLQSFGDYLAAWEYSPAYTQGDAGCQQLFDIPFGPEIPEQSAAVVWRILAPSTDLRQPWLLDLLAALGGEQRVAYLRTRVWSPQAESLILELGSDDGIKAWVNGRLVHGNNAVRAIAPAQEKVKVALQQGWNTLLLKVTQNVMGWSACARFRKPGGEAVEGLRAQVE
jgi:HEAT repeat protein